MRFPVILALGVAIACLAIGVAGLSRRPRREPFLGAIVGGIGRLVGGGTKLAASGVKSGAKAGSKYAIKSEIKQVASAAPEKGGGGGIGGALLGLGGAAAGIGGSYYVSQHGIPGLPTGGGGGGGEAGGGVAAEQPTYVGRQWDGADWSCPAGTVETGSKEDATACISSQFHPPVWKTVDGATWDWHCPNGTVPTGDARWERKCEVGWMSRQLLEGAWKCPSGTEDSGKTWDNSSWAEAQKQCRRTRPYTLRVNKDGTWVCPEGSTDTKRTWGDANEWDQCKWTGP